MPKIKVKEIKSIYTNVDENDSSFDLVRTSINLKHLKGYAQAEPRHLNEYDIPDLADWFGAEGWEYETGIYCTLTNDPFAEDPVADKRDVLVLITKFEPDPSPFVFRSILFKDLTNGSDWWEPTIEGNMTGAVLSRSFFYTTKEGKTFFQVENGRLKIYMPHDCFWLGLMDREFNASPFPVFDYSGWYCDRLVEPFDHTRQWVKVNGVNTTEVLPGTRYHLVTCGTNRRLGIKFTLQYEDDQGAVAEEEDITPDWSAVGLGVRWKPDPGTPVFSFYFGLQRFYRTDGGTIVMSPGEGKYTTWWETETGLPMDDDVWPFSLSDEDGYFVVPKEMADALVPVGTTWTALSQDGLGLRPNLTKAYDHIQEEEITSTYNNTYKVSRANLEATDWKFRDPSQTVGEVGFTSATDAKFGIIVTAVLDDREEIIIEARSDTAVLSDPEPEKFIIRVQDIYIPVDINKRITRLRFYHRIIHTDEGASLDYELHKEIDLLSDIEPYNTPFYLSTITNTGTMLATNIAFLVDPEKLDEYQVKTGFRSFVTESGISIALTNNDYSRAYYNVLGGGVLQPDLIYSQNLLPISGISQMTTVSTINDKFAVYTDNTMYIITVDQIEGALVFTPTETVALGVKNRLDVASVQGGAIVHTRNGIYLTSGTSQQLLSEPINDWIKGYYTTGQILYNKHKNELYYRPSATSEDLYRFRFEDNTWERINVSVYDTGSLSPAMSGDALGGWQLTNATDIFIDLNGERAYLETDKLWTYASGDYTMPEALLVFNNTDLGEPGIDKLFNEFIFDYIGTWTLYVYDDNSTSQIWTKTLTDHTSRGVEKFYFPLASRRAFKKCYFRLSTTDRDAKLYGFEVDFQILRQRSFA